MTAESAAQFFLTVGVLLAAAKVFGTAARKVGQPAVVGEIIAGIVAGVGPIRHVLVPSSVVTPLQAIATIAVALFVFTVGFELDPALLGARKRTAVGVAAGALIVPMLGGVAVALLLTQHYAVRSQLGFVLFMGIAMSVTAIPVLARVVADRGLSRQPVGAMALAAAAIGDVVAWLGFAAVAVISGFAANQWRVSLLPVYFLVLIVVARPLLRRVLKGMSKRDGPPPELTPLVVAGLLVSCAATEWLGVQYILGAFAFGAAIPRAGVERAHAWLGEGVQRAASLLLPLYFVVAGSRVDLAGFGGVDWWTLGLLMVVAVLTKLLGGYAGARLSGLSHPMALPLSVLMNVRGLTEIVMLSAGFELHLIDGRIYSIMVVMALATTAMAGPLLRATLRGSTGRDQPQPDHSLRVAGGG
jgi:Kef-type K+ transport system membrane component KefB